MADPGRQPPLETALHFAGQAGPREPLHAQDSAEAEGRNARSEIPAASDVPPAATRNAGAAAADSAQTLPAARPVFLRQLSDAAREGLITPERKAELRATSFAESCDLPPVMPALLRQISIAAKEGEISREERSQMKRSVLAGDAAALLDQLAHRPVESAHTKTLLRLITEYSAADVERAVQRAREIEAEHAEAREEELEVLQAMYGGDIEVSDDRRFVRLCVRALAVEAFVKARAAHAEAAAADAEERVRNSVYWSIKQAQWEAQRRVDENEGLPHHLRGLLGEDARKLAAEKTQKMQKEARKRRMVAQPGSEAGRKIMSFRVYVNFFIPADYPNSPAIGEVETVHNPYVPSSMAQRIDTALAQVAESRIGGPMLYDMASVTQDALMNGIKEEEGSYLLGKAEGMGEGEALAAVGRSGGADPVTGESIVVSTEPAVERPKTGFEKEWEWLQGLHASPAEAMRAGFNFEKCHYPSARYVGSLGEVLRSMKADMLQSGPAGTFAVLKCECVLHPLLAARFELKWAEMKGTLHESMVHPMVVFHGTRASLHSSIVRNGLLAGGSKYVPVCHGQRLGRGVYTSKFPSFAASYASQGQLIVCAALPGRMENCMSVRSRKDRDAHKYDSVCTGDLTEIVLPSPAQVLPVYVVTFTNEVRAGVDYIDVTRGGSVVAASVDHQVANRMHRMTEAELRRPTLSSAMAQPSATYSKKPALPPDDMWAEDEDEDASARARQSTGATLSKRQRSKRGAAANYSGGLDQAALQAKLQAYFGERAKHMQVMSIADVDDDDTHDGLLAYGGVAASQKAAKQLLDENTGDLQPARRDKPLPADDVEWEYADAGDAWRSW